MYQYYNSFQKFFSFCTLEKGLIFVLIKCIISLSSSIIIQQMTNFIGWNYIFLQESVNFYLRLAVLNFLKIFSLNCS